MTILFYTYVDGNGYKFLTNITLPLSGVQVAYINKLTNHLWLLLVQLCRKLATRLPIISGTYLHLNNFSSVSILAASIDISRTFRFRLYSYNSVYVVRILFTYAHFTKCA